ncbi:DUF4181 domain-containing protein [Bacillus tianshenii]|nr:DUF4181 domain-containing protein [Bacillus tianshenii]MCA1321063.1 DUF4181 domain-containing protein [Bacillus tianshenii]
MEPSIWLRLILVLCIFGVVLFFFNFMIRKLLKVERKKFFSYNHINSTHKKIDWTIRILIIVCMFVGLSINVQNDFSEGYWFLETYFLLFLFIVLSEIVTAFMEWKYAENKNAYLFTIFQLLFIVAFLLLMFASDFLGLIKS